MIAVIFELQAADGLRDTYLTLAAVQQWRNLEQHRAAQARGRGEVLAQYRLRVAEVVRDYGLESRDQVPQDSRCYHRT